MESSASDISKDLELTSPYWDESEFYYKPSELYKHVNLKVEEFQVEKDILTAPFNVGGMDWRFRIGLGISEHVCLFLGVVGSARLDRGVNHYMALSVILINADLKKSKAYDKFLPLVQDESEWGWLKFVKVADLQNGFLEGNTLKLAVEVQLIRAKPDVNRPFRCLFSNYGGWLIHRYYSDIEDCYHQLMEESIITLKQVGGDRLHNLKTFLIRMSKKSKLFLMRDKANVVHKKMVQSLLRNHNITSPLIIDSLYNGVKEIERAEGNTLGMLEVAHIIGYEKGLYVLEDEDICATQGSLMSSDIKQRPKVGVAGKDNDKYRRRIEKRFMELGLKFIEIYVFEHFISKINTEYEKYIASKDEDEHYKCMVETWDERGSKSKRKSNENKGSDLSKSLLVGEASFSGLQRTKSKKKRKQNKAKHGGKGENLEPDAIISSDNWLAEVSRTECYTSLEMEKQEEGQNIVMAVETRRKNDSPISQSPSPNPPHTWDLSEFNIAFEEEEQRDGNIEHPAERCTRNPLSPISQPPSPNTHTWDWSELNIAFEEEEPRDVYIEHPAERRTRNPLSPISQPPSPNQRHFWGLE